MSKFDLAFCSFLSSSSFKTIQVCKFHAQSVMHEIGFTSLQFKQRWLLYQTSFEEFKKKKIVYPQQPNVR